jgi:integrase
VIEIPAKRGRELPGERVRLSELPDDVLRKRKKTLNSLVSILRGAFQIAWEHDKLQSDRPMRCLRRMPSIDQPRIVFLDREECRRLLDACPPDFRDLVAGGLYTGCRATELTRLLVGDVDLKGGSIYISTSKNRRSRHVYLPGEGIAFFQRLVDGKLGNDRVFMKLNGRSWGGEYKTYFQAARSCAGLSNLVSFHGLRHTYASQLVQAGTSLMVVAEQLGHANTQTVSATYGHLVSRHRAEEIDARFEPLLPAGAAGAEPREPRETNGTRHVEVKDVGSWPRANHSRYSGPALEMLSRRRAPWTD